MSDIPSDILRDVLRRLPADSLGRLRIVCKAWRRIIDDPSFVRSHTINQHSNCSSLLIRDFKGGCLYSLSLETLNLAIDRTIEVARIKQLISRGVARIYSLPVPASQGLILIADPYEYSITRINWVIWNPLTRDTLKLPLPDHTELLTHGGFFFVKLVNGSLGYDHSSDDYKVVRIDEVCRGREVVYKTLVYSLKLGFWRVSKDCPGKVYGSGGVFLNGALYWGSPGNMIMMLDVVTEDYTRLQGPPVPASYSFNCLRVMGRWLVFHCYVDETSSLEGWILTAEKSWMKLFSIRSQNKYSLHPVGYLEKERAVILKHDESLVLFNVENETARKVSIGDMPTDASFMQFLPGSLFRLNDRGGGAAAAAGVKKKRKRKRKRKRAPTRWTIEVSSNHVFG